MIYFLDIASPWADTARMTLTERLSAYRERHDLTYQMLALRMAWKGCGLDPSTLFAICTTPDKPIAERTRAKIERFLSAARNGGAARRKAERS